MRLAGAVLLCVSIAACRVEKAPDATSDRVAVDSALEQYRQSWLRRDTAMALELISDSVRFLLPGADDLDGRAAVRALIVEEMAAYEIPKLTLHRTDLVVQGEHAIDVGTYDEIQIPKTGAPIHGAGRYMTIWRREAGGWRIWRFMINMPASPPPR